MTRILPTERIPTDLWRPRTLRLPASLSETYLKLLNELGLTKRSTDIVHGAVHGGQTEEETHAHFALRFAVSAGRCEFAVLAPDDIFAAVGNALLTSCTEGHVALLDLPCGTGATSGALISTLVELRRAKLLPRLPLTITVCAGDFAPPALHLYARMIESLVPLAASEGITLKAFSQIWDATRGDQTASLVDRWFLECNGAQEHIVLISNFSGALNTANQFDLFTPNLHHVLARLHDKTATLIWLEPATNEAKRSVFEKLKVFFSKFVPWFAGGNDGSVLDAATSSYGLAHPVNGNIFGSNVMINKFTRQ